jgi:hypothetical protein
MISRLWEKLVDSPRFVMGLWVGFTLLWWVIMLGLALAAIIITITMRP